MSSPNPPSTSAGSWFSQHKALAIGGAVVGLLLIYYLYKKNSSSSSAGTPNVSSGSGSVDLITPAATASGSVSGAGEQAYYQQLQQLQSSIDAQLQSQLQSSGQTASSGSSGSGSQTQTTTPVATQPTQPTVSYSPPPVSYGTYIGSGYNGAGDSGYTPIANPSDEAQYLAQGDSLLYEPQPGVFKRLLPGQIVGYDTKLFAS
jgi:hypothetical protein